MICCNKQCRKVQWNIVHAVLVLRLAPQRLWAHANERENTWLTTAVCFSCVRARRGRGLAVVGCRARTGFWSLMQWDCYGLSHEDVAEFFSSFCSILTGWGRTHLLFEVFCFILLVWYRQLGYGTHTDVSSEGPLRRSHPDWLGKAWQVSSLFFSRGKNEAFPIESHVPSVLFMCFWNIPLLSS